MNWGKIYPGEVVSFVQHYYSTIPSQKNVLRSFRNFALTYYPEISTDWIELCKLPAKEHRKQTRLDALKVLYKSENQTSCDVEFYLRVMCELLGSSQSGPAELAAGLLMATGRRTVELAQCGVFNVAKARHVEHQNFWLHFSGPAKKHKPKKPKPGQKSQNKRLKTYGPESPLHWDIPVLVASEQILACFSHLKKLPEGQKTVKSKFWQVEVKNVLRQRLSPQTLDFLPKTCRAVYARVTHFVFNPPDASVNLWAMRALGHARVETSMNYLSVHVYNVRNPCETFNMRLAEIRLGQTPNICSS
jgi:hypothetical protein